MPMFGAMTKAGLIPLLLLVPIIAKPRQVTGGLNKVSILARHGVRGVSILEVFGRHTAKVSECPYQMRQKREWNESYL
jgi:hypothetical protein